MKISSKIAGLGGALALALGSQAAVAQGPSYDYIGASYVVADPGPDSSDGFRIELSGGLTTNIHLLGDWVRTDDLDQYRVALGYNLPLTNSTDFVVRAGWIRQEDDRRELSDDKIGRNGYNLEALTRMMVNDQFELNFGTQYSDVSGEIGDSITFNSGFVFTFAQGVAIRGSVGVGTTTAIDLGVRWNFGGFR